MKSPWASVWLVGFLIVGCSVLMDWGQTGLPCDAINQCIDGFVCDGGRCTPSAEGCSPSCDHGEVCFNAHCIQQNCATKTCVNGTACDEDTCVPLECIGVRCPQGEVCQNGDCKTCATVELSCSDNLDEDCDGKLDCADDDCLDQACEDGDPCTKGGVCTGAGQCVSTAFSCSSPPNGQCYESSGTCLSDGGCAYVQKPPDAPCTDNRACTQGDRCNGSGICVPGPLQGCTQPSTPCQVNTCDVDTCVTHNADGAQCGTECRPGTCSGGGCNVWNAADGTKCNGDFNGWRCCGGSCVDTAWDDNNCGTCGRNCPGSSVCRPITDTVGGSPYCSDFGPISGRCTCSTSNLNCDVGTYDQICRTVGQFQNVCVPTTPPNGGTPECGSNQKLVKQSGCPAFCCYTSGSDSASNTCAAGPQVW